MPAMLSAAGSSWSTCLRQPVGSGLTEVDRVIEPADREQRVSAGTGGGGQ